MSAVAMLLSTTTIDGTFDGAAELPRYQVDNQTVSYTTTHTVGSDTGCTTISNALAHVIATENMALNHKIIVPANATYDETVTVGTKTGNGFIDVVSSSIASLPAGVRVNNTQTAYMYTIRRLYAAAARCITGEGLVHNVRFIGAEIYQRNEGFAGAFFRNWSATSPDDEAHHILFDRCYIHGDPTNGNAGLLSLHGRYMGAVHCQFEDVWGSDDQKSAFGGIQGSGPYLIDNCGFDRVAGITIFFGGGNSTYSQQIAQDITITRNYFTRPLTWNPDDPTYGATEHQFRHYIELKHGVRVLIDGNIFENHWCYGGYAPIAVSPKDGGFDDWLVNVMHYDHTTHRLSWTGGYTLPAWATSGTVTIKQSESGGNWIAGYYLFTSQVNSQCVVLSGSPGWPTTGDADSSTGGYGGVAWCPWAGVDDFIFRYNVIRHGWAGLNISFGVGPGGSNNADGPTRQLKRCSVHDNLTDDTPCQYDGTTAHPGTKGYFFAMGAIQGAEDFRFEHNTGYSLYPAKIGWGFRTVQESAPSPLFNRFWVRNNIIAVGDSGSSVPVPSGSSPFSYNGSDFLANIMAVGGDLDWNRNLFIGGPWPLNGYYRSLYTGDEAEATAGSNGTYFNNTNDAKDPGGDWIFTGQADPTGVISDYVLNASGDYHNISTDGEDLGCDCTALATATSGCVSGSW